MKSTNTNEFAIPCLFKNSFPDTSGVCISEIALSNLK